MRNCIASAVLLLLYSLPSAAGEPDNFTYLFARTCMQHFYAPEKLVQKMADASVLEGQASSFFLDGNDGTAWAVADGSDKYVVVLRNDGVCAVFAQHAPAEEVHRNFVASVGEAPLPLVAIERSGRGPNSELLKTVAYAWTREQDQTELLFTLTTSSEENATVQAMASMAIVAK